MLPVLNFIYHVIRIMISATYIFVFKRSWRIHAALLERLGRGSETLLKRYWGNRKAFLMRETRVSLCTTCLKYFASTCLQQARTL